MARSIGTFGESGGLGRGIGPSYTFKSTKSGVKTTGSISKPKKKTAEGTSFRSSELSKSERKAIKKQNKAADTMKSKDLDAVERGQRAADTKRRKQKLRDLGNMTKGAVATAVVIKAGSEVKKKANKSNKKK
jgi:hypothetical protein